MSCHIVTHDLLTSGQGGEVDEQIIDQSCQVTDVDPAGTITIGFTCATQGSKVDEEVVGSALSESLVALSHNPGISVR